MSVYSQIISNIKAVFSSTDLNTSKVALFEKIANSISPVIDNTLSELANTQSNIENIIGQKQIGRSGYYTSLAILFEYDLTNNQGVDLIIDPVTKQNVYENPDISKQIIKIAIFDENSLVLKVAYLNPNTGLLDALPTTPYNIKQLFDNYFQSVAEIPGINIVKVSDPPNKFSFVGNVTYFSTYDLISLQTNVINAVLAFRDSNPAINGIFYINDLADYVKANVPGIRNFAISDTQLDGIPFSTGSIVLLSGYFNYISNIQNNLNYATA